MPCEEKLYLLSFSQPFDMVPFSTKQTMQDYLNLN